MELGGMTFKNVVLNWMPWSRWLSHRPLHWMMRTQRNTRHCWTASTLNVINVVDRHLKRQDESLLRRRPLARVH
jgi:hypothetical protein